MGTVTPEYIKQIISESTTFAMNEINSRGLLKPIKDDAFRKTEKLLYSYSKLKKVITKKIQQIESIKSEGLKRRSTSIVSYSAGTAYEVLTDAEKADAKIDAIKTSIAELNGYIETVDAALIMISNEPYCDVIRLKYFEGVTNEDVSCELLCDVSTVTRNKNKLVNILKIYLFPEESIMELF
ncbi:MAG: hypothetical protein WCG21_10805 [Eubacteriales bacterium]